MGKNINVRFLSSASLGMIVASSCAFGQTATAPGTQPLEEIVVTANKRSENVQKVPTAITVASGDLITAIGGTDPQNLAKLTPGLAIGPAGAGITQIYIRGVGSYAANAYSEGAVAFQVDGIYFSRPSTIGGVFYDLARVEVLKGPQGTLYGRNATGGTVNLITNRPSFSGIEGDLTAEVGNYSAVKGEGALNVPINDKIAVRGAFQVVQRDGYLSDGYDDEVSQSGRGELLYKPHDKISLLIIGDYSHRGGKGGASVIVPLVDPSNPWLGPSTAAENSVLSKSPGPPFPAGSVPIKNDGSIDQDSSGVTAELDWDLGFADLVIQPGYRSVTNVNSGYEPGFLAAVNESSDQTSVEARLASPTDSSFTWTVGTYYFHENQHSMTDYGQVVNESLYDLHLATDAKAVFGQVTVPVWDRLRLTGGLRYGDESKDQTGIGQSHSNFTGGPLPPLSAPTPITGSATFKSTDYRAGLEYDLAPENLLYANVSTGFKAGGFFAAPPPDNSYKPEKLTAYAIGSKNSFFDRKLTINAEGFIWDYKDHQESHLSPGIFQPAPVFRTDNVAKETIKGIDLDGQFRVTPNDIISLQYEYLDAVFNSFTYRSTAPLASCGSTPFTAKFPASSGFIIDCSGLPAVRAPKHSGSIGYQHSFELSNGGIVVAGADMRWATKTYLAVDYLPSELQGAYHMTDMDVAYHAADDRWSITAFVRNLENAVVESDAIREPFKSTIVFADIRPPQTYGVRVGVKF